MAMGDLWHYSTAAGSTTGITYTLNANAQRLVSFKMAMGVVTNPKVPLTIYLYDGTGTTVTAGTATLIGSWVINKAAGDDYILAEPDIILYSGLTQDNKASGYQIRSGSLRLKTVQGTGTNVQTFLPHLLLVDAE
jgi:hypothetical protein